MTGTIFLEASELSIGEPNRTVFVPIVRTGDLSGSATIEYGITPNTATVGADYVGGTGTITMQAGQARVVVPVQILNDGEFESTETFAVSIINVDSSSTLLFPRTARVDILDDENPVVDPPDPPLSSSYNVTQQAVITGLSEPMAFEFAPQDPSLVFVAEKGGRIRVFDLDSNSFLPDFIDLTAKVNNVADRGLMDIALHPNFPELPYVYAFYVVDPPDTAGLTGNAGPDGGGNRFAHVVRFTADAATGFTTVVPGSEVILVGSAGQMLQDISGGGSVDSTSDFTQPESGFNAQTGQYLDDYIKLDSLSHAGGSLAFGPDGALYISIGDGSSYTALDPRTLSVQNVDSLSGKVLRVDPITGLGLPDNPFVQPGASLDDNSSKVYQLGLRNPFSMGFDQDGHLIITNTGWYSWEEIESGPPGANFGWPYYEGGDNGVLLRAPGYQDLPGAAAFFAAVASGAITVTPAFRAFAHASGEPGFQNQAITGGNVVYTGSRYPAEFQNDFFFTDIVHGGVFVVDVNDRRDLKFLYQAGGAPVHFSQGPDGYVYYADLFTGVIGRLLIGVAPTSGPVAVNDTASTSAGSPATIDVLANDTDPNGDALAITSVHSTTGTDGSSDQGATVIITGSGANQRISYDGSAAMPIVALAAGATLTDRFSYVISDGNGGTATAVTTITVTGVNDLPSITSNGGGVTAAVPVAENSTAVTAVAAIDPDVGQSLVYAIVGGADAARFTLNPTTGVLAFVAEPNFEAPDDANGDNVYNVMVEVSDGSGGVASQQIAITVTNVDGIFPPPSNAATIGTTEDDVLTGKGGANTINALAGNDALNGTGGKDTLNAGPGNDTLTGGTGNDTLNGDDGNDVFSYTFGDGADAVNGGAGLDTLNIVGTTANNTLDVVFNGTALTTLEGGTVANVETVTADLLSGVDTLTYAGTTSAVAVNLATGTASGFASIANIENVTGGSGNDTLVGNDLANRLSGGNGNDGITGGGGNDALNGGSGNDTFVFAPDFGSDTIAAFDHNPSGGQDLLDISAFGITLATFASRVTLADSGSDIMITLDGNANQVITLAGVPSTGNITAADFILFG